VQGFKVLPARDRVTVDGREVRIAALAAAPGRAAAGGSGGSGGGGGVHELCYFLVHKPVGFICR
jgi:hypothetical protein